jgi:hypothetical protein
MHCPLSTVLYDTRLVLGERFPLGRAAALLARCPPPTTLSKLLGPWTCSAVQIATRVPLSLYLGPRLVNAVSLRKRPNSLYLQHKLSPCPAATAATVRYLNQLPLLFAFVCAGFVLACPCLPGPYSA